MTTHSPAPRTRRALLWSLTAIGCYVGIWATFLPASFHASFPGPFGAWVAVDGAYNEHLVRDVGTLYLGLAAAGLLASRFRDPGAGTVVGLAWVVFSIPHLAYHVLHLGHFGTVDAVAQVVTLSLTIVLGAPLLLPVEQDRPRTPGPGTTRTKEARS